MRFSGEVISAAIWQPTLAMISCFAFLRMISRVGSSVDGIEASSSSVVVVSFILDSPLFLVLRFQVRRTNNSRLNHHCVRREFSFRISFSKFRSWRWYCPSRRFAASLKRDGRLRRAFLSEGIAHPFQLQ